MLGVWSNRSATTREGVIADCLDRPRVHETIVFQMQ